MKSHFINVQRLAEEVFVGMVANSDWTRTTWAEMAQVAFEAAEAFSDEVEARLKAARAAADTDHAKAKLAEVNTEADAR